MLARRAIIFLFLSLLAKSAVAAPTLIKGGTIVTITKGTLAPGDLLIDKGLIVQVGPSLSAPPNATVIDASGKFVLPGFVDTHSHIGVYSFPFVEANADGNEMTDPITPHMRVIDAINLEDPAIERGLLGGVTTVQILPGSGNLIGGESAVIKLAPGARRMSDLLVPNAPRGLKMALGENPKRVYGGELKRSPSTRMGNIAVLREAFQRAVEYRKKLEMWRAHAEGGSGDKKEPPPPRDLKLEVLSDVLAGKIRVHVHCYRTDDIGDLFRVADEFKFPIASLQHALEAYKIADEVARRKVGVATFVDLWGFKEESWDAIPQGPAVLAARGVRVSIQSDHPIIEQRWLHIEAAKSVKHGLPEEEALKAISLHPAWMLGLDARIGSLEPGKEADVVIWSGHPFRIRSRVEQVFINGKEVYRRDHGDSTSR